MLVDVTQGHIIEDVVRHQAGGQDHLLAQHHTPLRTVGGPLHCAMGGEHCGKRGVELADEPLLGMGHDVGHFFGDEGVDLLQ